MIIYYSGEGSRANPEITLGNDANLMLTYIDFAKAQKPTKRFRDIIKARKAGRPVPGMGLPRGGKKTKIGEQEDE